VLLANLKKKKKKKKKRVSFVAVEVTDRASGADVTRYIINCHQQRQPESDKGAATAMTVVVVVVVRWYGVLYYSLRFKI
jgi:hypothetical protein